MLFCAELSSWYKQGQRQILRGFLHIMIKMKMQMSYLHNAQMGTLQLHRENAC